MNLLRLQKFANINFVNLLLISFFFLCSIFIIRNHYDGHHIGLVYSNALDLISGKSPYKEIFIQYGFLTTIIHALLLILFDNKLIFISFFTAFFYSLSILLISLTIKNLVNSYYSFLASVIILFNHPIPWLPWSNYIAFFFLSLGVFFLTKKNKNFYLIGLFFSLTILSRQDFFIPLFLSFLFFFGFYFLKYKKISLKKNLNLIFGFSTPLIIFLIYLFYKNIFFYWKDFLIIPSFYLEIYETTLVDLITNFIVYFLTDSFFNFIITPQYFIISIILISNTILIFLKIFNKIDIPSNILYLSVLSCFLCSLSLKIEIFRLYTSVIIGLIPLLYFFHKIKNENLKSNLIKLLVLPSIFALFFYPLGNNPVFKNINFKKNNLILLNNKFDFYNWPENKIKSINLITEISQKCNVEYLDNLTFDTLYSTIGNFDRVRMLPFEKNSMKNSNLHFYLESIKNSKNKFYEKINLEIANENIILLIKENNYIFRGNKIVFTERYDSIKINESNIIGRPNILYIYLPKKCLK